MTREESFIRSVILDVKLEDIGVEFGDPCSIESYTSMRVGLVDDTVYLLGRLKFGDKQLHQYNIKEITFKEVVDLLWDEYPHTSCRLFKETVTPYSPDWLDGLKLTTTDERILEWMEGA